MIGFSLPWALALVLALPLLWRMLRVLPPPPRVLTFPPIRLLYALTARPPIAQRMPPWLLILRLTLAALLILALSGPRWSQEAARASGSGPLLLVIDDGWAASADWSLRQSWALARVTEADRTDRPVWLLTTAPPGPNQSPALVGPLTPPAARALVAGWLPRPWPTDRAGALKSLAAHPPLGPVEINYLTDGLDDGSGTILPHALAALDHGMLTTLGASASILELARSAWGEGDPAPLAFTVKRPNPPKTRQTIEIEAIDDRSLVLERTKTEAGPDDTAVTLTLSLPPELRNRVVRVGLTGQPGPAATWLMDEGARLRKIGIDDGAVGSTQPLLDPMTYAAKALSIHGQITHGEIRELIKAQPSVIVTAQALAGASAQALGDWVGHGGLLLRFAAPDLGSEDDELLPAPVQRGDRALGGQLSWTAPQSIAPFGPDSPFSGLAIPPEVTVTTQLLTDPNAVPQPRVWARLTDGTPLVSAKRLGAGWVVLFHVGATPDGSTLPLSGLFPDLLRRLVAVSHGGAVEPDHPQAAYKLLDGLGRLVAPEGDIAGATAATIAGVGHPPGLYGPPNQTIAVNLAPALGLPVALDPAGIAQTRMLERPAPDIDFRIPLIVAVLALMLADLAASAWIALPALLIAALGLSQSVQAADDPDFAAALTPRFGFILTGDGATDAASAKGLAQLTKVMAARSTAELAAPAALDPEHATLLFYPLIYWPVVQGQPEVSTQAAERVGQYLAHGGMIVFDRHAGAEAALRRLGDALALPVLVPLPSDHVLTRTFYLLTADRLGPIWVAGRGADKDGVSPLLVTSGDWAPLWAAGPTPETETAFRFGINLGLYALTGNYKADQVHLPAILRRLEQGGPP